MIFVLEPYVKNKIEESINTGKNAYHVSMDGVKINLLSSEVKFFHIKIYTDKTAIDSGKISAKLSGTVNEISFTGIGFLKALFKKEYVIDEIKISDVQLVHGQIACDSEKKQDAAQEIIIPSRIKIGKTIFKNSTLVTEDFTGMMKYRKINFKIPEISIEMCDINKNDTLTSGALGNITYKISEITCLTQDSLYQMKLSHLEGNNIRLSVDSILLIPQYDNYEFTKRNKYETDRVHLALDKLTIEKFRLNNLIDEGNILAGDIKINKLDVDVFRDKRMKDNTEKKPMVQELLMKYKHLLKIDSLELKDGNVKYTEHAEDANKPGKIYFTRLKAKFNHVTNDTSGSKDEMKMHAQALLMDKSKVNVSLTFPVNDPQNKFICSGSLASMNMEDLNPILERNAYIYVTGKIKKMKFNFSADNLKSRGDLELLYNDLHITAKNQNTDETTAMKEKIISFIANNVIIESSNPMDGEKARTGIIDYQRNPQAFLFNYSWKSILSGIKSTIQKAEKEKNSKKKKKKSKE